jgi:isocitrate dehydrogenase
MRAARMVIDAAVAASSEGSELVDWRELQAGESSYRETGEWLPQPTLDAIKLHGVALKGPLTTPVGGGIRSLNVAIRQKLDLYASVRPVRFFRGVPSPVKEPEKMDIVIFRENTEDVYKGLEWPFGSKEAQELRTFLGEKLGTCLNGDTGIGLKPISRSASTRLVRAAIDYALKRNRKSVTLVHKGNIMKFTEGAFKNWGYELARNEFSTSVVAEDHLRAIGSNGVPEGKILLNDRIADNMFQQILTRPEEYSVLATTNLNGDYLSDACAAQVGGLGIAPGANIGDGIAVFEAVHGTASKYAGKNVANPCAMILSGAMMLEHLGLTKASASIVAGVERTFAEGIMTQDLARRTVSGRSCGTDEFARHVMMALG